MSKASRKVTKVSVLRQADLSVPAKVRPPKMPPGVRQGMWVVWTGPFGVPTPGDADLRVGIVTGPTVDSTMVVVSEVRPHGVTVAVGLRLPVAGIKQAKFMQIPEARRPRADKDFDRNREIFSKLGYN